MRIGIDASNIRGGGGVTYLREILRSAQPEENNITQIIVWGGSDTLDQLDERSWLKKVYIRILDSPLPFIILWRLFIFDRLLKKENCDLLFVPGVVYNGSFHPYVAMSQNMLPFIWSEARRYRVSWMSLKFIMLHYLQLATFKRANGVIFLTEFAHKTVGKFLSESNFKSLIIPHGVDIRFQDLPRLQKKISCYSKEIPFHLLYISSIAPYKHQWHVMNAVWQLRQIGFPVALDLVGPILNCKKRFQETMVHFDPKREWINYQGEIPYTEVHDCYKRADAFIFASSCENLPNILLEAMSGGLPIACSNRGPMPEVLGEAGFYFDPENPESIAQAIQIMLEDPDLRQRKAFAAYERVKKYTWKRCARETFKFISHITQMQIE